MFEELYKDEFLQAEPEDEEIEAPAEDDMDDEDDDLEVPSDDEEGL